MTINGSVKLQRSSFTSLTVNGAAQVEEVSFSKEFIVNGSLDAIDSKLQNVVVNGTASFTKCKIVGLAQVAGPADFYDCELKDVQVTNLLVTFENCKVSSIVMKKLSILQRILGLFGLCQKVELNDTVVSGDVIFEQGNGIVVLTRASRVIGNIIGGKIVQEES